jgi:hypothetical protein
MKRTKIVILAGLLIIFAGIIFFYGIRYNFFQKQNANTAENSEGNRVSQKILLTIDRGEGNILDFESDFNEGISAFDFLREKMKGADVSLETQEYDLGIFIQAIGDEKNGDDGKYWLYYINGQMPQISADNYLLKAGDKVDFKFEKSPF